MSIERYPHYDPGDVFKTEIVANSIFAVESDFNSPRKMTYRTADIWLTFTEFTVMFHMLIIDKQMTTGTCHWLIICLGLYTRSCLTRKKTRNYSTFKKLLLLKKQGVLENPSFQKHPNSLQRIKLTLPPNHRTTC